MSGKSETTHEVDARTNQPVQPLEFDVNSHDDYLRLREAFRHLPKIPTLLRPEEQPTATAPNRSYNWLLTLEQSGGSIVLHVLTVEPASMRPSTTIQPRRSFSLCWKASSK
jgi:hypothetical protein